MSGEFRPPWFELDSGLRASLAALAEAQTRAMEAQAAMSRSVQTVVSQIPWNTEIAERWRGFAQAAAFNLLKTMGPLAETMASIGRLHALVSRIEQAGWLPHYTTPFTAISEAADDVDVRGLIENHYRENWTDVRKQFLRQLRGYDVDEEAKETFAEALGAHEHGFFRSTCRLLFPEIERVVRTDLLDGKPGTRAGVIELQEAASQMGLSEINPGGLAGFTLYMKLAEHLYVNVYTKEDLQKVASDAVPNRHAAIHGLVAYKTFQNSMNVLIMGDFIFQVVAAAKTRVD